MKKAFSLMELIVVIVIIGLIASVGIPKLMGTKTDAQVATIRKDVNTIISSIQTYYLMQNKIETISDVITLNSAIWKVNDTNVIFKDNEKECIIIELLKDENKISLTINEDTTSLCQKIYEKGIITTSYDLY